MQEWYSQSWQFDTKQLDWHILTKLTLKCILNTNLTKVSIRYIPHLFQLTHLSNDCTCQQLQFFQIIIIILGRCISNDMESVVTDFFSQVLKEDTVCWFISTRKRPPKEPTWKDLEDQRKLKLWNQLQSLWTLVE